MAKNKVYVMLFLVFLAGSTVLCGCGENSMGSNVSARTKRRVIQDCMDKYGTQAVTYYGTYNGWIVVSPIFYRLDVVRPPDEGQFVNIGGLNVCIVPPILAWKDGKIHELKDAYDLGLLTRGDLIRIVEYGPKEEWHSHR